MGEKREREKSRTIQKCNQDKIVQEQWHDAKSKWMGLRARVGRGKG